MALLEVTNLTKIFPVERKSKESLSEFLKSVTNVKQWFRKDGEKFCAVENVNLHIEEGESIGLVGETGAGKTTLCMMISRLIECTSGGVRFHGEEISTVPPARFSRHKLRSKIQMVFQDPTDALNPSFTAFRTISGPLVHLLEMKDHKEIRDRVETLADKVHLPRRLLDRYPHQLSGGEKARVGIARAISTDPVVLLLDEATSALDVSVQGQILLLLEELRKDLNLTFFFVSHDLGVVRLLCSRVLIMQNARIIEEGFVDEVFSCPKHKHTRQLLESIPKIQDEEDESLVGTL